MNPVVRVLLRSPAHGLMSGSMLLLDYVGRRSGRRYVLPVMYAVGDDLVVVAGQHEAKTLLLTPAGAPRGLDKQA